MSTHMRCRLMLLAVLSAALLSHCFTIGGPARSFALVAARAAKIPRSIRAPFTNPQMMTARGFGKRSQSVDAPLWSFNKPSDAKFYNDLVADGDSLDDMLNANADATPESFPIEWLAGELMQSPAAVQALLRRFVDTNRDGLISTRELLQPYRLAPSPQSGSLSSASSSSNGPASASTNGDGLDLY